MNLPLPRSPLLMSPEESAVLVVDMQPKLLDLIDQSKRIAWNVGRLLDAADVFDIPKLATEQYPKGLGPTHEALAAKLEQPIPDKLHFSCGERAELFHDLHEKGIHTLLVCGIETHVCVMQTVFDLLTAGFHVQLPVDAVGARFSVDHQTALNRLELGGATLTSTETALFEWCEKAGTPEFKQISALVRADPPD